MKLALALGSLLICTGGYFAGYHLGRCQGQVEEKQYILEKINRHGIKAKIEENNDPKFTGKCTPVIISSLNPLTLELEMAAIYACETDFTKYFNDKHK
ncbi:MAG: hypothetical protein L6266_04900 [Nanoarchaeota archaeon]|nr:hypothetical protein [Nanoarchaeota archaeon]